MTSNTIIITIYLSLIQLSFSLGLTLSPSASASGGNLTTTTSTPIPSYPTIQSPASGGNLTCHLDLSSELFGGVSTACSSSPLDRDRCCPVLAAWLFAAHARSALSIPSSPPAPAVSSPLSDDVLPLMPDDSQKCVDSLHASLEQRNIRLPRPNDTCDTVLCFCGIRLHQIRSLSCPAAFNVTGNATGGGEKNATSVATPTAAVKQLEKDCRNSSYAGCTRCLQSLEKLKGGKASSRVSTTDRAAKMFSRDCQLMGLTWLLARNKTLYIPTVSAVLRAVLYSTHPPTQPYKCRADQENMPLAVDSLQIQKLDSSSAAAASSVTVVLGFKVYSLHVLLFALFLCGVVRM